MSSTLCLFRQDPARGGLLRAIFVCLAVGAIMRAAPGLAEEITDLRVHNLPGGFGPMYLLMTALAVTLLLAANSWTRSSRLALGLPFTARRVWTVRTVSLIGVGLVSVSALTITMGLSVDLASKDLVMNPVIALAAARAAVTVVLLLFVFQLPLSERDRIPITAPYVVYVIFSGVLILVFSAAVIPSAAGTLVLLIIDLALGAYLYFRLPSTFSIGPTFAESEASVWTSPERNPAGAADLRWDSRAVVERRHPTIELHWAIFRALKHNFLTWVLLIAVGGFAAVAIAEFFSGTNALLPLFFLVIYQLPLFQAALEGMAPFDSMPISRWILWAHSIGPIIVSVAVGAGIAISLFALNPHPSTHVRFDECCVKVPWDYLELSRDGRAPTVSSAWGETFTPQAHPVWRGRMISLYDPYEVGPESSPRFVEFQMRRAIEAVYDIPVPEPLFEPGYQAPPNIVDGVGRGAFNLEMIRGLVSVDRNRSAAVAVLFLSLLSTALMLPALLQFCTSTRRKLYKRAVIGFLVVLGVIALAVAVARLLGFIEVWYVGALISIGIRSFSHSLPFSTPILWFFCVTFWAGTYLLLGRVFKVIEFPPEKTMNRFAEEY